MTETDDAKLGPAMAALNERQRAFVEAYVAYPKKTGRNLYAVSAAGYGTKSSSRKSLGVIAARLVADTRIQAAIAEEAKKVFRALAPAAIHAVENLVNSPGHRDHGRALGMIIDRADPVNSLVRVEHQHQHEHRFDPRQIAEVRERIAELAKRAGVPAMIDGEFKVVGSEA